MAESYAQKANPSPGKNRAPASSLSGLSAPVSGNQRDTSAPADDMQKILKIMESRMDKKLQKWEDLFASLEKKLTSPPPSAPAQAPDAAALAAAQQQLQDMGDSDTDEKHGTAARRGDIAGLMAATLAAAASKKAKKSKPRVLKVDAPPEDDESTTPHESADDNDSDDEAVDEHFIRKQFRRLRRKHRGSAMTWFAETRFNESRNLNECHAWAEVIDAYIADHPGESTRTLELMFRRLAGVHLADSTGDWSLCDALQGDIVYNSLLDNVDLRALKKTAKLQSQLRTDKSRKSKSKTKSKTFDTDDSDSGGQGFDYSKGKSKSASGKKNNFGKSKGHKAADKNKAKPKDAGSRSASAPSASAGADAGAGGSH